MLPLRSSCYYYAVVAILNYPATKSTGWSTVQRSSQYTSSSTVSYTTSIVLQKFSTISQFQIKGAVVWSTRYYVIVRIALKQYISATSIISIIALMSIQCSSRAITVAQYSLAQHSHNRRVMILLQVQRITEHCSTTVECLHNTSMLYE